MWHASPIVGNGYKDYYVFSKDGTFKFKYGPYNDQNKMIDISGDWEITTENLLLLSINKKTLYINEELTSVVIDPPEKLVYSLGTIKNDNEYYYPVTLKINEVQYWKLGSNGEEIIK